MAIAALPAPALARSGGAFASKPGKVDRISCRSACAGLDAAKPGSLIRLHGRDLGQVSSVVFLGGPGAGDDVQASAVRVRATRADVRVPARAVTGRVRVINVDGAPSAASRDAVVVETGARRGGPLDARVATRRVFVAGPRRAKLDYVVTGDEPLTVAVALVRADNGATVATWAPGAVEPGRARSAVWDGTIDGAAAPEGRYQFRVYQAPADGAARAASEGESRPVVTDSFLLLGHRFPVVGSYDYGGFAASFGGGRGHQGQDVFARCGTPLVAARGGVVRWKASHSRAGHYVVIDGEGTDVDYAYMHLRQPSPLKKGDRVATGQRIGEVGQTGRASGCHLHFEMWSGPGWYEGGRPFDPLPHLRAWAAADPAVASARRSRR